MIIRVCNGCRERIADDADAVRDVPGLDGNTYDWCAYCWEVVRVDLPRLAAEARAARTEARKRQSDKRVPNLWPIGGLRPPVPAPPRPLGAKVVHVDPRYIDRLPRQP